MSDAIPSLDRRPSRRFRARELLKLGPSATHRRLIQSIEAFEVELAADADPEWSPAASELLTKARSALNRGDVDSGYFLLAAARRRSVFGYDEPELDACSLALRLEAGEKMGKSWRGKAVVELLDRAAALRRGPHSGSDSRSERELLYEALGHRDEAGQNGHRRFATQRRGLAWLTVVLFAALGLLFTLAALEVLPEGFEIERLAAVAAFGAIGGALSAIRSVSTPVGRLRVPEQAAETWITFVRPIFGAAAAIAVLAFAEGQLLGFTVNNTAALLAVAFAAGFTERIVVGAVARWERASADSDSSSPPTTEASATTALPAPGAGAAPQGGAAPGTTGER